MQALIFGWGTYGKTLRRGLEKYYGIDIVAVCDNDENKWWGGGRCTVNDARKVKIN